MKNTSHVWTSSNLQALGAPDVVLRGDPFRLATLGFAVQASDGTVENYGWGSSLIWLYGCNMVETKKTVLIIRIVVIIIINYRNGWRTLGELGV